MLDEGRQARRQRFRKALLTWGVERAGHEQRAGIVVDAIAVRTIGYRTDRMLEKPRVVTHRQKMAQLHLRRRAVGQDCRFRPAAQSL